ncbi:MAG: DUF4097 domain-containing protein [Defluviitaleaceae bacterium]|nr:DUF4097 domain-containing protein [Defluviitaleaceae bacterium]
MSNDDRNTEYMDIRDNGQRPELPEKKGNRKGLVILVLCLALVGLWAVGSFVFRAISPMLGDGDEITQALTFNAGEVDHLNIRMINGTVNVETHNAGHIGVVFTPPTRGNYVIPSHNFDRHTGTLTVGERTRGGWFNFGTRGGGTLTIFVPTDANGTFDTVDISTTNGRVSIVGSGGFLAKNVSARTTNGAMTAHLFGAGSAELRSTNGRVDAEGLDVSGDLVLRTTNGGVILENSYIGGHLTARTTNGGVTLVNVDADTDGATLRATNGRVRID